MRLPAFAKKTNLILCILWAVAIFLCGCAEDKTSENAVVVNKYSGATGMEQTAVIEYTMPKTNPNILTDYCGYESTEEKRAVIVSDYIPDSFAVVDRETGDIVYEGRIILKTSSSGSGFGGKSKDEGKVSAKSVGYADFSDFTTPGTYYIKCEKIGLSFDFEIKEELYLELLNEALEE
ncbi:MAG: hypothetical protein J6033_07255, partial [Lachnospiraceae bacterium]|nr:hypothetical protein [Lachnospiraceae bacterium]